MVFRYIAGISRKPKVRPETGQPARALEVPILSDFEAITRIMMKRRSIRKYSENPISDSIIYKILESAAYAPSAGNQQPWEFIVVKDPHKKEHLAEAAGNQTWMKHAPVIIVACTNMKLASAIYGERGERLYGTQGVAAAIENMLLTAESLGLSTCWVGAFSEGAVSTTVRCPEYIRPCAMIAIGYGAEHPKHKIVQRPEDYIHKEEFGRTLLIEDVIEQKSPTTGAKTHIEYWG